MNEVQATRARDNLVRRTSGLPDGLKNLLAAADKQKGWPAGTMESVVLQETGGKSKYIDAPDTYHYEKNADGRRIAGHTGKVSTAFGPFGILESTAAKPGYGVAPLKDKSLNEQVRFASDYLEGRVKQAGSLEKGLAGYGEGEKYAKQVLGRVGGGGTSVAAAAQPAPVVATSQGSTVIPVAEGVPLTPEMQAWIKGSAPKVVAKGGDEWEKFNSAMPASGVRDLPIEQLAGWGNGPGFAQNVAAAAPQALPARRPDFSSFKAWGANV